MFLFHMFAGGYLLEDGPRFLFHFRGGVGGLFGSRWFNRGIGFEHVFEKSQNDHVEICLTHIVKG